MPSIAIFFDMTTGLASSYAESKSTNQSAARHQKASGVGGGGAWLRGGEGGGGSIPTWANHWVNGLMGYWVNGLMGRGSYFSGGRVFRNIPYVSKHASPSPSASVVLLASYNIQRNNTIQYKLIPILLYAIPSLT